VLLRERYRYRTHAGTCMFWSLECLLLARAQGMNFFFSKKSNRFNCQEDFHRTREAVQR